MAEEKKPAAAKAAPKAAAKPAAAKAAPKAAAKKSAKKVETASDAKDLVEKVSTSAAAPDSDDAEDSDGRGGRNRRRRIRTYARQGNNVIVRARKLASEIAHNHLSGFLQISSTGIIAQTLPQTQQRGFRRLS